MTHYTGSVPESPRKPDWRDDSLCRNEDPELFFPKGYEGPWQLIIEQAKAVCRRCPVVDACLQFALTEGIPSGIFGGLTETERVGLRRSARRNQLPAETLAEKAAEVRQPQKKRTLRSVYDDHTVRLHDGHLAWTGPSQLYVGGRRYTPLRVAFIVGRGYEPNGPVTAECGRDCVLPEHLADMTERSGCGTRNGYARHRRNGEPACDPCRVANNDANNRLVRTGTTKELV